MTCLRPTHACIYRLYSVTGELLYVGCSASPRSRVQHHNNHAKSRLFRLVARMETDEPLPIASALYHERVQIRDLQPLLNVADREPRVTNEEVEALAAHLRSTLTPCPLWSCTYADVYGDAA